MTYQILWFVWGALEDPLSTPMTLLSSPGIQGCILRGGDGSAAPDTYTDIWATHTSDSLIFGVLLCHGEVTWQSSTPIIKESFLAPCC